MVMARRLEAPVPDYVDPENRTSEQELEAHGVFEKRAVTDIKWVQPYRSNPKSRLIKVGTTIIHLPDFIANDLGERVLIGTGKYNGRVVLLIKTVEEGKKGYRHYGTPNTNKRLVNSPKLVESLIKAGAQRGYYEPIKIRGGWMCEEVKI